MPVLSNRVVSYIQLITISNSTVHIHTYIIIMDFSLWKKLLGLLWDSVVKVRLIIIVKFQSRPNNFGH